MHHFHMLLHNILMLLDIVLNLYILNYDNIIISSISSISIIISSSSSSSISISSRSSSSSSNSISSICSII